jgi:hypothetical protein
MTRLAYILSLMALLLTLSHNVSASTTVQTQDIIIIGKVEHRVNLPLMAQIDSASYFTLKEKLDFSSSTFSWNFRGHVATFEIKGNKLFLSNINSSSSVHTDFKGLLDKYMDRKGRVFASWISGTFICGTGECLYVAQNGFDSVYERETELIVENGVVVSSRTYSNKSHGTVYLEDVKYTLPREFDLSKIKAPRGRVTVRIDAAKFSNEGKVAEWSIEFLRGHDNLPAEIKEMVVKEVNRVFNPIDWKTYCRDGEWRWIYQNGVTFPLIFQ